LKINYTTSEITALTEGKLVGDQAGLVQQIHFDTRRILDGANAIFLCLKSSKRDGHNYISEAYEKGVRHFLVSSAKRADSFKEANFILVDNVQSAIQKWARAHRLKFSLPIIAITGSAGKTVLKEQIYAVLSPHLNVSRSPKSYNSQLGVALSLFEITSDTHVAIIEAGISFPGEMEKLRDMIQPTLGVFTSFGQNHRNNFKDHQEHLKEKLKLFDHCSKVWMPVKFKDLETYTFPVEFVKELPSKHSSLPFESFNLGLFQTVLAYFKCPIPEADELYLSLPKVALRMETVEGQNKNTIIHDAFNWTFDGFEQACGYQAALANGQNRLFVFDPKEVPKDVRPALNRSLEKYGFHFSITSTDELLAYSTNKSKDIIEEKESVILIKGNSPSIKRLILQLKERRHSTVVEIHLGHLRRNIAYWKGRLPQDVKLLAMLKAASYGVELGRLGQFVSQQGFAAIGVAYADEGVELRRSGVELPIIVMSSDQSSWGQCIENNLEPSIFSIEQLDEFVKELIHREIVGFPVHLKVDTGMNRLGFKEQDRKNLLAYLHAQPEIRIKSVFSHLAMAGDENDQFTLNQINDFEKWMAHLKHALSYKFEGHILNSHGAAKFPQAAFDMVRMGIGMYGISSDVQAKKNLYPVLSWKSCISQIKEVKEGEKVGYGGLFTAPRDMRIAIVPVGYADGFRRSLGLGKGGVYLDAEFCPVVGQVCMDMCMVDLGQHDARPGDEIEIIGEHQSVESLAKLCDTIPYEIMTGLSRRMPRVFVENQ
jgi:alanine racemase